MKKIFIFCASILAAISFVSCNKELSVEVSEPVIISVSSELPIDSETKVNLVESGTKFTLEWDGKESVVVANSSTSSYSSPFSFVSHTGTKAVLSGTLPSVTGETTNYIAVTNFTSVTTDYIRADLPSNQTYGSAAALANNCILVARTDDAPVGTLGSLDFKTMNSFINTSVNFNV